jgi:hypothetical protein
MLKQSYVLANKIVVANVEDNNVSLSVNSVNSCFYLKYSRFTLKALNKRVFQKFLFDMLKLERIPQKNIGSISIEILPAPGKNGLTIAGKCNIINGKIRIYPKPLKFCYTFRKEYGEYLLVEYAGNRARASLIHELLHLKYGGDEVRVRKLTKEYYSQLIKNEYANSTKALHMCNLIFAH